MAKSQKGYGLGSPLQNVFPQPVVADRVPAAGDTNYELGQVWINKSTDQAWTLTSVSAGSATWSLSSPGSSDVDTINSLSPTAGNINVVGGTNLTESDAGSTVTMNMDAAISLATSVTAPLYTAGAGVDLDITAPAGQDVVIKLGDAAGANKLSITDSSDVEVFSFDSSGAQTLGATTYTGLLTAQASMTVQTAGTALNLGSDNSGDAVNLGVGTTARAIGIGNSAAAHTLTIGSTNTTASLDLQCGTGNFTLEGNVASTYAISNTGVNTGQVDIAGGTGARTINIGGGGTGAKTINIGAAASADVITIGSTDGVGSMALNVGTGNFALEGNVASTYAISNTGANTGQVDIAGGTGARTVNLGGGGTGVKTINIGRGATADVISIGTSDGAGSLDLACGTGNFSLEGNVASTYAISNTGANTGQVDIAGGTGARTVNLAGGGTGVKTVNIGRGATADVISIGTSDGAGSLDLACGTGNFSLEGNVASTYAISNTGANTGQVDIAGGTGARTINLGGGGTGVKTINIGRGATAEEISRLAAHSKKSIQNSHTQAVQI
jgi:hypothetical protein